MKMSCLMIPSTQRDYFRVQKSKMINNCHQQITVILNPQILLLMNNYTHAYSDYVNHILNKSPSKTTYSFARSERFPQKNSQNNCLQFDQQYQQASYHYHDRYTPQKEQRSPIRNKDTDRGYDRKNREQFHQGSIRRNVEQIYKTNHTRRDDSNKSKSPVKSYTQLSQHQNNSLNRNKSSRLTKQSQILKNSPSRKQIFNKSPSKSPHKRSQAHRYSPNKTFTQHLQEIHHVSKNITINGYYPTGLELSAEGKSPISTHRNTPSYSFGNSSYKQRYRYIVKSEDHLGPGYYENFSEFGQQRKI